VQLLTRLSEALKLFKVEVSDAEQHEEETFVKPTLTGIDYYKFAAEAYIKALKDSFPSAAKLLADKPATEE